MDDCYCWKVFNQTFWGWKVGGIESGEGEMQIYCGSCDNRAAREGRQETQEATDTAHYSPAQDKELHVIYIKAQ